MAWACMGNYCFKDEKMTIETTRWSAADSIETDEDAILYLKAWLKDFECDPYLGDLHADFLISVFTDVANSPWMEQRAKDGKQVILAGKG